MTIPPLRTRKPTGRIPFPLVLLEGGEGSGKTYAQLALSADPRIKEAFHIDLGEGSADEYATLGTYRVVEHNGTIEDILGQVRAVKAHAVEQMAADPSAVVALTIDSVTALWSMLSDEARATAKARGKEDPTMALWNKAKMKWRAVIDELMTFPGVCVVTARGHEVAEVLNGKPTTDKVWKVQAQKDLVFDVNVIVRFVGHQQAHLVKARSLRSELAIPEGRTLKMPGFTLADLIFDRMGCGTEPTQVREVVPLADTDGVHVNDVKVALMGAVTGADPMCADPRAVAAERWGAFVAEHGEHDFYPVPVVEQLIQGVAA
ncbi:ATP-binding protein [Phycicoccus sp. MAQZ13P-2]|uniref:AAA family ATPase n=1 Tax=Phycicoccus mangrovi TaxID=2840470 RepID=UPI001BFFFD05|nr:AAA family ATPase [Phycicoccus mangrovi]MBT9254442.1 ATP-binding protein [Phycicoccus mangrovi]MBT9272820.1 ATP-binding protein [Phycicoccus mangrovi]